uniref:Uncharacterized protein n=1 Tax=Cacopsylla melanoneura TaxID=428564 RepID=A0A8D8ZCC4_9HEMI
MMGVRTEGIEGEHITERDMREKTGMIEAGRGSVEKASNQDKIPTSPLSPHISTSRFGGFMSLIILTKRRREALEGRLKQRLISGGKVLGSGSCRSLKDRENVPASNPLTEERRNNTGRY